jgi:hypothetical protein
MAGSGRAGGDRQPDTEQSQEASPIVTLVRAQHEF